MSANSNLRAAARAKKDEFYTQLSDIENELRHYRQHFRDKVVYCNCDDPTVSNFYRFFHLNFEFLGLKKLITTCYKNQQRDIFSQHNVEQAIGIEYAGDEPQVFHLKGDGDFRSQECIEILEQADVVVTNPPFSLFRKYVAQLIEYDKHFLIIGNMNALTYKEIFPLIQSNQIWMGVYRGVMNFVTPENKISKMGNARWYTNLDYPQRHEDLILYKRYSQEEYPKYDNYDAINVSKTDEIPEDYAGAMGVPISFLDKHNPGQFELLGIMNTGEENIGIRYPNTPHGRPIINGKEIYLRVLIRNKRMQ